MARKEAIAVTNGVLASAIGMNYVGEAGMLLGIPAGLATQYNREIYDYLFPDGVRNVKEMFPTLDDIKTYPQRHPKESKIVGGAVGATLAVSTGILTGGASLAVYLAGLGALGAYSGSLIVDPRKTLKYTAKPFKAIGKGLRNSFGRPEITEETNPRAYKLLREIDSELDNETINELIQDGGKRNLRFLNLAMKEKDPAKAYLLIDMYNAAHRWGDKRFNNRVLNGLWHSLYRPYKTIAEASFDVDTAISKRYIDYKLPRDSGDEVDKSKEEKAKEPTRPEGKSILSRINNFAPKSFSLFYGPL